MNIMKRGTRQPGRLPDGREAGSLFYGVTCEFHRRQSVFALQHSCEHHEEAAADNHGRAIKGAAQSYPPSLLVLGETQHVETIRSNVVSGRSKCHDPEQE